VEVESYDPAADLRDGFDYGDRAVAKVTLDLETVWIRSWLEPLMPPPVKTALGLSEPAGASSTTDESR
jgi:hypothetical protein